MVSTSKDVMPKDGQDSGQDAAICKGESEVSEKGGAEQVAVSRRALLRAGWAIPVVLMVTPPTNVFAQGSTTHADQITHVDTYTPHTNTGGYHTDSSQPHYDYNGHSNHSDWWWHSNNPYHSDSPSQHQDGIVPHTNYPGTHTDTDA